MTDSAPRSESTPQPSSSQPMASAPPRRWVGPLLLAAAIITPIVILILSNREPSSISWAQFSWEAPGWVVIAATFVAGILLGPVLGWAWRRWRRSGQVAPTR